MHSRRMGSRSAGHAGWPTSRAARSAIERYGVKTKMHSRRRSSSLPASTAVMGIVASRRCCSERVGKDRVERIWRREGLKVPQKQKPRGRLWLNDGSCVRLRPERVNHIWSYDFVSARTRDGRSVRLACRARARCAANDKPHASRACTARMCTSSASSVM